MTHVRKFFRYNMRLRFITRPDGLYCVRLYLLFGWMLNWLRLPDEGPLHNHPSESCSSKVLFGWYDELVRYSNKMELVTRRRPGPIREFNGRRYHKILRVSKYGCLTLFKMQKRVRDWYFLVDGVPVPHQEWKSKRSRSAINRGAPR